MVRKYIRKTTRGCGGAWSKEDMTSAVEAVANGMSIAKASVQFDVPYSTLHLKTRGWKGRPSTSIVTSPGGRRPTISQEDEMKLADMLKIMAKWGFGLGKQEVRNVVREYLIANNVKNQFKDNQPGRDWFTSFCSRHKLSLKKPELLESSRSRQSNGPFVIFDFYEKLEATVKDLQLQKQPEAIYNCDESGFCGDPTTSKVVTSRGAPAKRVTGGNARKTTTVLATVNAVGKKLPPLILHKGKRLWNSMIGEHAFPGTSYSVSDKGWMTERVFYTWFRDQFLTTVKERPALLIYDGHLSHVGVDLIKCAIESQVTILKLPPHTSHILQPLDVCVFRGVKSKWDGMLAEWARQNYGKKLPKSSFANIFGKVWSGVSPDVIKKGFEKCGIFDPEKDFPVNSGKIKECNFDPEKLKRYKQSKKGPSASPAIETAKTPLVQNSAEVAIVAKVASSPPPLSEKNTNVTFETLLLKTVTPTSSQQATKKKRIDNAEIITMDSYLKQMEQELILSEEKKKAKPVRKPRKSNENKKPGVKNILN